MDYLGPGLGLTDKLIDKHFDRIPTKVFDKDTYKRKNRRSSRRNSQQQQESSSGSDSEDRESRRPQERRSGRDSERNQIPEVEEFDDTQKNHQDIARHSGQGQTYTYGTGTTARQYDYPPMPIYSNEPPRLRPQYVPTPPPGQGYPPSVGAYSAFPGDRSRDRNYDSDDDYYAKPARSSRRPRPVTRRSSSYHGPRDRRDYNNSYGSDSGGGGGGGQLQRRRRGSEIGTMEKAKDVTRRYGVKEEVEDVLTTSKAGLAGSAVGAVVGGWAANKAQVAYGKDKRRHESSSNPLLTLLGAAAGGLAVDVLVARYEDQKKEANAKEKNWEDKFGNERNEGRRGSDSGRRRRRDSYND